MHGNPPSEKLLERFWPLGKFAKGLSGIHRQTKCAETLHPNILWRAHRPLEKLLERVGPLDKFNTTLRQPDGLLSWGPARAAGCQKGPEAVAAPVAPGSMWLA